MKKQDQYFLEYHKTIPLLVEQNFQVLISLITALKANKYKIGKFQSLDENYFISNITKHRYNLSAGINDFLSYIIEEDKKNNKSAKKKD